MLKFVVLLSFAVGLSQAMSGGAPKQACETLTPQHAGSPGPQDSQAPFSLAIVPNNDASRSAQVMLLPTERSVESLKGFMIQSRLNGVPSGVFTSGNDGDWRYMEDCDNSKASVTHKHPQDKTIGGEPEIPSFKWTPDAHAAGVYTFHYTIVKDYSTYWANIEVEHQV